MSIVEKTISEESISLLEDLEEVYIVKTPRMTDEQYDEVREIFEYCNYKWSERYGAFISNCNNMPQLLNVIKNKTYHITDEVKRKEELQFYPTPKKLAEYLVKLAELEDGDVVLEPSAGVGNILSEIPEYCRKIVIEYDRENSIKLISKGYLQTMNCRFEDVDDLGVGLHAYNKVVMNPPFTGCMDAKHVMLAFKHLSKGGRLVSIINENTLYYRKEICARFMLFLKENNAKVIEVPTGSFSESGTMVNTLIIVVDKK